MQAAIRKIFIAWVLTTLVLVPGCTTAIPTTAPEPSTVLSTPLVSTVTPEPLSPPTPTPLPESILLEPMNYQEQVSSSSANTSVAILLGYYDHWVNQEEVDDHLTPITGGMVWYDFAQYASQYRLKIRAYASPSRDPVRLLLANSIPVIIGLQISPGSNDIYFRVLRGYDDASGEFICDDPRHGPEARLSMVHS